jgi:hypothetical protein
MMKSSCHRIRGTTITTLSTIAATVLATISSGSARVPVLPARERRRFTSWAASINNVSQDQIDSLQQPNRVMRCSHQELDMMMYRNRNDSCRTIIYDDNSNDRTTLRREIQIRGGGSGSCGSILSNFPEFIASSKSRSWTVLLLSIVTDALSTTLMKTAQVESSTPKLVLAFCGYFVR